MSVNGTQRITTSATALLGLAAASPNQGFDHGICYRLGAGTVTTLQTFFTSTVTATSRMPYPADGTGVLPLGTYTAGFCVRNNGAAAMTTNDWVNGWVIVSN